MNARSQLSGIKQYDAPACHDNDGDNACDNSYDDIPDGNSCNVHVHDDSDCGDAWAGAEVNVDGAPTAADLMAARLAGADKMRPLS